MKIVQNMIGFSFDVFVKPRFVRVSTQKISPAVCLLDDVSLLKNMLQHTSLGLPIDIVTSKVDDELKIFKKLPLFM